MTKSSPQLSTSKKSIQWATAPFDKPKTESVILRSTDNIYFNVRRGILAEASPIFEDMFAHSSPATNATLSLSYEDETIDGLPLRDISGADYCILLRYRTACVTATTEMVLSNNDGIPPCPWLTMKSFFPPEYNKYYARSLELSGVKCASGGELYASTEFRDYLMGVSKALSERPSSKVLSDVPLSIMMWTVARPGPLSQYSSQIAKEVSSLEKELARALEDAVSKVSLEVDH